MGYPIDPPIAPMLAKPGKLPEAKAINDAVAYIRSLAELRGRDADNVIEAAVQFANQNVFGVRLDGGALLWSYSSANNGTANIATPIIEGDHVLAVHTEAASRTLSRPDERSIAALVSQPA